MRKHLQLIPVILFPYLAILVHWLYMFNTKIMYTVFHNSYYHVLSLIIIMYLITLLCSLSVFVISLAKKKDARELLRINVIIKLIHVPAYIYIFYLGCIFILCGIMSPVVILFTVPMTIALIIFDGMSIVLSGLIGLSGIVRSLNENKISKKAAYIHGVFQFIFCLDVISAILIYRKVKRAN